MAATRIIHVDDEPDIRKVVCMSLEFSPEIIVRSCASGAEALKGARDWLPDLVLLDVMMPNMDGPATLAGLQQDLTTAHIPVVFMTARVTARELDYFRSLGAAGIISKPFEPTTLAAELRTFLKWRPGLDTMQNGSLNRASTG